MILQLAQFGLSASADGSQTSVRTRDAVVAQFILLELQAKAHLIKQSMHFAAVRWVSFNNQYPLMLLRKTNEAIFQSFRRSSNLLTARGGTDGRLLTLASLRMSPLLPKPKTGHSPKILLINRFAKRIATALFISFMFPNFASAAWLYVPASVNHITVVSIDVLGRSHYANTPAIGTIVYDDLTYSFKDLASIPLLSQPALNPVMIGMPVVSYGGLPVSLDPLNPANAVQIGKAFAEYGSYMLGVAVLGLFLGMSFGGILGLIRRNTMVI